MNWTTIGIMCLALAMILGPVLFMQPSKRERRLAALRAKAAEMGLRVQMEKLRDDTFAAYGKPWPLGDKSKRQIAHWRLNRMPYTHGLHIAEHWHVDSVSTLPPELIAILTRMLDQLPESVVAVEVTASGARCYWKETGGESALKSLSDWLDQFIVAAVPFIRRPPID